MQTAERLTISYNAALQNLNGLNNLTSITGPTALGIGSNDNLTSLKGLENLKQAPGSVAVSYNRSLADFCGLKPFLALNPGKQNLYL